MIVKDKPVLTEQQVRKEFEFKSKLTRILWNNFTLYRNAGNYVDTDTLTTAYISAITYIFASMSLHLEKEGSVGDLTPEFIFDNSLRLLAAKATTVAEMAEQIIEEHRNLPTRH